MIHLISTGEYSDYRVFAILEGDGDVKALYNQFREQYTPEMIPAIQSKQVWLEHGFYDLIGNAEKRFVENGMTGETFSILENAFTDWLVKEHNFTLIQYDEINVDWRELPE